jgi:hypothetical protein
VAKDPVESEETNETSEDGREKMKVWFSENLRMIVSIVIVVVIAGGIYSYSKRSQSPSVGNETAVTEQNPEGKISVIGGETDKNTSEKTSEQGQETTEQPAEKTNEAATGSNVVSGQTSQETGISFTETAVKGDSTTKLARKALANYLEKNPDANLTAEHKIYIEDFLRRQVKDGRLKIGETREFSKDTIAKAIEKSKGLSEKQLKNLQKYSQRVPDLK